MYYGKNIKDKRTLIDQLLTIKKGMNNNRINFNFPKDPNIVISEYWLLGLIEAKSSFYLDRSKFQPAFIIGLSKIQRPIIEKIQ